MVKLMMCGSLSSRHGIKSFVPNLGHDFVALANVFVGCRFPYIFFVFPNAKLEWRRRLLRRVSPLSPVPGAAVSSSVLLGPQTDNRVFILPSLMRRLC